MSQETIPTVTVMRGTVAVRINATDYDPSVDKLAPESEEPAPAAPVAEEPAPAAPVAAVVETATVPALGLLKKGRRYFVVSQETSEPVSIDGIDEDGYTTEAAAVAAAQAAMAG